MSVRHPVAGEFDRLFKLGFTATQRGLTRDQRMTLGSWVAMRARNISEAHHGDCVGGDDEFDQLLHGATIPTVIHPPTIDAKRAFCLRRVGFRPITELDPSPYLVRNHHIVQATQALWAAPGEMTEQLRSGTWATVRYARKLDRPIRFFWPDGTTTTEPRGVI